MVTIKLNKTKCGTHISNETASEKFVIITVQISFMYKKKALLAFKVQIKKNENQKKEQKS